MADGARKFSISLTTPDGAVFEDEVEMAIVPGAAGEIGVLARHAPLIALLKAGSTRIYANRESEEVHEFATGPGFFTVELDRAIALVDTAVNVREIDPATAEAQLEDTIRGFTEILDGKHDDLPEQAFYMVGTIDDAVAKAREQAGEPEQEPEDSRDAQAEAESEQAEEPEAVPA